MNYKFLKDVRAMSGFTSAIILSVIAVVLAINNYSFWLFIVVISLVVLALSVYRADKLYKDGNCN